jgi:hypothetical protein
MSSYGGNFNEGDRVEISPRFDLWMEGARFGTVTRVQNGIVHVRMDHPHVKGIRKFKTEDLQEA